MNRSALKNAPRVALAIYIFCTVMASPHYWWIDVKAHDSLTRAILWSPVVGMLKSACWPYSEFVHRPDPGDRNPRTGPCPCSGWVPRE